VIVVAGGTGTLGTRLAPRLAGQGLAIRVLTRDPARARHLAGPGVEVVRGDVRDPASVAHAVRGASTVISAVHGFTGPGGVSPASVDRVGNANLIGAAALARAGLYLLRPARHGEPGRPGAQFFKPLRQIIESVNDTFKGQLDLERHGGHTPAGVITRVLQRILALTAAIWHNNHTAQPVMRSLIAYDHY
jgi:NAD(P)-dependent dehydrogenase (short-subunit alcohol dehydrogenase family)